MRVRVVRYSGLYPTCLSSRWCTFNLIRSDQAKQPLWRISLQHVGRVGTLLYQTIIITMIYSEPAVYVQLSKTRSNLVFPYLFHLFLCFYLIPYLFLPLSLPVSIGFLACFYLFPYLFLSVSLPVPDHSPFIDPALLALSRLGVPGTVR